MFDLLGVLLPKRCIFCQGHRPASGGRELLVCTSCLGSLPWRLPGEIVAPLYYKGAVRSALHRYKFNGASGYAKAFGTLMAQAIVGSGVSADVITWIPCSFFRRWSRGYDQSEKLARAVSKCLHLPSQKLLVKKRHAKSQTKMADEAARRENVRGVFSASSEAFGKRVLLIDDIYTTGATMEECRQVLLDAGAEEVTGCVLAAVK
jgi:ComF family protein